MVVETQPIKDALPEHLDWRDTGCDVSPSCFTCPLPICRYEVKGGLRTISTYLRAQKIVAESRTDPPPKPRELAKRYGVAVRTIYSILARERDQMLCMPTR